MRLADKTANARRTIFTTTTFGFCIRNRNDRQAKKETNIISFIVEILQADSEEILTL